MRGGVIGDSSDTHDPFLGVVNRHERSVDDIIGQPLDPELCRIARKAELDYFRSKDITLNMIFPYSRTRKFIIISPVLGVVRCCKIAG